MLGSTIVIDNGLYKGCIPCLTDSLQMKGADHEKASKFCPNARTAIAAMLLSQLPGPGLDRC